MYRRALFLLLFLSASLVLQVHPAHSQDVADPLLRPADRTRVDSSRVWRLIGRVTTPGGGLVSDAKIVVEAGLAGDSPRTFETNLKGEFRTEYAFDGSNSHEVRVTATATKQGWFGARESVDFTVEESVWRLNLVLREDIPDSELMVIEDLVAALVPRLKESVGGEALEGPARDDFLRGAEACLDRKNPLAAVSVLETVAEQAPGCVRCRALLGLALLNAGSWVSAERQFAEALALSEAGTRETVQADLLTALGVMATWQKDNKAAENLFHRALQTQPDHPLALQELGRVLLLEKEWEAAARNLDGAIDAGALGEALLLRAHARLELGEVEKAHADMTTYLLAVPPSALRLPARLVYLQLWDRLRLREYEDAKSVVEQPLPELIEAMPELEGTEPGRSQQTLPAILSSVAETVELFFRSFQDTTSLEDIHQEVLGNESKVLKASTEKFEYLMLSRKEKWGLGLTEYRSAPLHGRADPDGRESGPMKTEGFASSSLYFHPLYQSKATFRYLGRQMIEGQETIVLAFAQRPDTGPVLARFEAGTRSVPILHQGIAWVDPATYRIVRMRTDLLKIPHEIELERLTTEVQFDSVRFKMSPTEVWVPRDVAVTVLWKGKLLRNRHHYSEYRLFDVKTRERGRTAKLGAASEDLN